MIHSIQRDGEIIVAVNGFPYVIAEEDPRYYDLLEALSVSDEDTVINLLSTKKRAENMFIDLSEEGLEQVDGQYYYKGNLVPLDLGQYLANALKDGKYKAVVKFVQRLFENPSDDTRKRLFAFMQHNKLPLDDEGRFLAFKAVTHDYKDIYTKTVDNSVGVKVPIMAWSDIDTDSNNTCSRGYHACSKEYIVGPGSSDFFSGNNRVVAVAIGPEDVGAIPADYNNSKLRCRTYEVIADITDEVVKEQEHVEIPYGLRYNEDEEQYTDWDLYY